MPETRGRRPETSRIEAFSDAVLAIVLTLLVLDLLPKEAEAPGQYLREWPRYLAYLTAFFTVGAVWINHHAAFGRLERADGMVFGLNLLILLGTSLVPWPAAAVSLALNQADRPAQLAAVVLYAVVTCLICVPWTVLDLHLGKRGDLLGDERATRWFNRHARATIGTIAVALVSVPIALWSPLASLFVFLAVVLVFVAARVRETRDS